MVAELSILTIRFSFLLPRDPKTPDLRRLPDVATQSADRRWLAGRGASAATLTFASMILGIRPIW